MFFRYFAMATLCDGKGYLGDLFLNHTSTSSSVANNNFFFKYHHSGLTDLAKNLVYCALHLPLRILFDFLIN